MNKIIATIAILVMFSSFVYANCGNDKGTGKDCNDTTQGPPSVDGKDGKDGIDGTNGTNGIDGRDGTNATNNDPSVSIGAEVIWFEHGRVSIGSGYDYDMRNNNHSINAARLYIRVGKSGVDRELEKLRREVNALKEIAHRPGRHQHVEEIK